MNKKKQALEIIERLKQEYPDAGCTLDYDDAWKLLVSVRLAAQCTDARVNVVVQDLYANFQRWKLWQRLMWTRLKNLSAHVDWEEAKREISVYA